MLDWIMYAVDFVRFQEECISERISANIGSNQAGWLKKITDRKYLDKAEATSIRGQYGRLTSAGLFENVLHCSANEEEAEQEIKLWFEPDEIVGEIYPTKTVNAVLKKRSWK